MADAALAEVDVDGWEHLRSLLLPAAYERPCPSCCRVMLPGRVRMVLVDPGGAVSRANCQVVHTDCGREVALWGRPWETVLPGEQVGE
jgi:hypothetical protein